VKQGVSIYEGRKESRRMKKQGTRLKFIGTKGGSMIQGKEKGTAQ
jgi:hypothetical protein